MKSYLIRYSLLGALGILVFLITDTLISAGTFKSINPHFKGNTVKLSLPVSGPEDITIDSSTGIAFISCDDRRTNQKNPGSIPGAIFILQMNDSSQALKNVTPKGLIDFHPHGISLFKTNNSKTILFAISHRLAEPKHVVERFEWRNDSLIYLETIADPDLMTSPNDLAATGERSFYITNDHYYPEPGIGRTLEEYLQRAISYVNYFDGNTFKKVADKIAYTNGIQVSRDGKTVYVASILERNIQIFDRSADHKLKLRQKVNVSTGADNIELDENGDLLVGCHPQLLKFVAHAGNPEKYSPSQILRIRAYDYTVEEIFLNDGSDYSGSTVAAPYRGTLLVGSVFEPTMLILKPDQLK